MNVYLIYFTYFGEGDCNFIGIVDKEETAKDFCIQKQEIFLKENGAYEGKYSYHKFELNKLRSEHNEA